VRAEAHGRRTVRVRDLPIGGRPVVLAWRKRIWRCREPACRVRTWTERVAAIGPRAAVLTQRAWAEACRRVGKEAHAAAAVGRDFLKATRVAPTRWITGLVDLEGGRLLEVVADRTRAAVAGWLQAQPRSWLAQVGTVALDPWRGYASALATPLGHARVVVDHLHAIRPTNTIYQGKRRVRRGVWPELAGYVATGPTAMNRALFLP
jgi:transposase